MEFPFPMIISVFEFNLLSAFAPDISNSPAEPPVAIVEKNAEKKGNLNLAKGYLNYLYSPAGQEIAARNFYRPRNATTLAKYKTTFKPLKLVTIDKEFGGWEKVQKAHFENGGVFDQIVKANSAK